MLRKGNAANAYIKLLDLIAIIGELIVFSYFTLDRNPAAIAFILAMPACMVVYFAIVSNLCRAGVNEWKVKEALVLRIVAEVCERYRLVADYFQRPQMNEAFAATAGALRKAQSRKALAKLNDDMFPQWLGPGFTGLYIAMDANNVLTGQVSLGTFLATISILGSISGQFARAYCVVLDIVELTAPVRKLTVFFNKQTDLLTWKAVNRQRRENTRKARGDILAKEGAEEEGLYKTDLIELRLENMSYSNAARTLFQNVNVTIPQGKLVAVAGGHGSGKSTLMRLLSHIIFPKDGCIFFPSHLRILHLAQEPLILNASAWVNLVFGVGDRPVVPKRIRKILEMMGMTATLKLIEEDLARVEREGRRKAGDTWSRPADSAWMESLTYTEKVKMCLARALIMNPEVMVLQRPLHHYDAATAITMEKLLRAHVVERGLVLPEEQRIHRRPRTAFFTLESAEQAEEADMTLYIQEDGTIATQSNPLKDTPVEEKPVGDKPVEEKPAEEPPAEAPPAEAPPAEAPPAEEKPAEEPPAEEQPAEERLIEEMLEEEAKPME
ncbi:ssuB [Symbiodinium natans]|uniref:SsuB protein n=1 Tax=Symbiodinium natans TaxID=878477 RepID=A0A812J6G1_9DINO|nr:ssuB [Symbiodinium natans]